MPPTLTVAKPAAVKEIVAPLWFYNRKILILT